MNWIKCSDRLPERTVSAIVWGKNVGVREGYYNALDGFKCWMYHGNERPHFLNGVTHWMPLPEPPKEDE